MHGFNTITDDGIKKLEDIIIFIKCRALKPQQWEILCIFGYF
jgi:hypothetical protein